MKGGKPVAIAGDVFAGLFTLGVTRAGFRVPAALEHGSWGTETAKLNFPKLDVRVGKEAWRPREFRGADLFFTNPPCAPWSNWNRNSASWKADPRIFWVDDLIDAVAEMRPRAWIWESVPSTWAKGRPFVLDKAKRLEGLGYSVAVVLQNNMYVGATQNRKRVLVVAHRHPLAFPPLVGSKTTGELLEGVTSTPEEVEEAAITPWERKLWRRAGKLGGYLKRAYDSLEPSERTGAIPSFMEVRLKLDEPPPLIAPHRFHPTEPRRFTYSEQLALVGLPPTWKTAPGVRLGEMKLETLRCVLPGVGAWIARAVRDGLSLPAIRKPEFRIYDFRSPEKGTLVESYLPEAMPPEDLPKRGAVEAPKPKVVRAARSSPRPSSVSRRGTSKDFIRGRLSRDGFGPNRRPPREWADRVADDVRAAFPNRTTKASDVYYVWARQERS